MTDKTSLMEAARTAAALSYSPYSGISVGAALLTSDGKIFTGCNIENAAYSPSICAERCAFSKAISDGNRSFSAIAVCGDSEKHPFPPCGVCRQVMAEFCEPEEFEVYLEDGESIITLKLSELLPHSFGKSYIQ